MTAKSSSVWDCFLYKLNEDMRKLGISEENMSIQMAMCVMLIKQAVFGNLKAYQLVRDQIQQNPKVRRR